MSINLKSLALNDQITSTSATARELVYSATNGIAQIDQATVYNSDASARDLYYYILANTTTTGSVNQIGTVNIAAGATELITDLIGHKVPANGSIQCYASVTNVLFVSISGMERQQ